MENYWNEIIGSTETYGAFPWSKHKIDTQLWSSILKAIEVFFRAVRGGFFSVNWFTVELDGFLIIIGEIVIREVVDFRKKRGVKLRY